jgi:hypothetical protein
MGLHTRLVTLLQAELRTMPLPDLPRSVRENTVVGVSLDAAGSAVLLTVEGRPVTDGEVAQQAFWRKLHERPHTYVVAHQDGDDYQLIRFEDESMLPSFAQPLPDGRWLLAPSRGGEREKNAGIYSGDGSLEREFSIDDAVEDIQVSGEGAIWVSYFDENPQGLWRFDADGQAEYRYEAPKGVEDMYDCYALNVASDAVWCCYYAGFPLARIVDDDVKVWSTPGYGSNAFAIDRDRLAFMGSYDRRSRLYLCEIEETSVSERAVLEVRDSRGNAVTDAEIAGRGTKLLFHLDGQLSMIDIRDIVALPPQVAPKTV